MASVKKKTTTTEKKKSKSTIKRERIMKLDDMTPANIIKNLRLDLGKSQTELAQDLKINNSVVSMYERGNRTPGFKTIRKIVDLAKENGIVISYRDFARD